MFESLFISTKFKVRVGVLTNSVVCMSVETLPNITDKDVPIEVLSIGYDGENRVTSNIDFLDQRERNALHNLKYSFDNHVVHRLPLAMPTAAVMGILEAFKFKVDVRIEHGTTGSNIDKIKEEGIAEFSIQEIECIDTAFIKSLDTIKSEIADMDEEDLLKVLPLLQSVEDNIENLVLADFIRDTQPITFPVQNGELAVTVGISRDVSTFINIASVSGKGIDPDFHVNATDLHVSDTGAFANLLASSEDIEYDGNDMSVIVCRHILAFKQFKLEKEAMMGSDVLTIPYPIPFTAITALLNMGEFGESVVPKSLVSAIKNEFNTNVSLAEKIDESMKGVKEWE